MMRTIEHRTIQQAKEAYQTEPKSGNKNDIVEWLIKTDFVTNYIQKLLYNSDYDLLEDITQEIWLILLDEISQDRWNEIYSQGVKNIIQFTSGVIYHQIRSKNSKLFKAYKQHNQQYPILTKRCWDIYERTNIMPVDIEYLNNKINNTEE